jgi:hypothetical protein
VSKHVYLRAYMAGVTVPSVLMVFSLASFCVVRFGYHFPFPIERGMVFPLALVPPIWGLWNLLYIALRRHRYLPLGLHGAVIPLFVGPLGFATIRALGVDIPPLVVTVFPFGVAVAIVGYYLVWKYLVGFLNELVEVGS